MKAFGLIGKSLSHSYSKSYFEEKFRKEGLCDCQYRLFEISSIEKLPELIASESDLRGFNVTIPYKKSILDYLDELLPEAAAIGAVNVVRVDRRGKQVVLKGYNTDSVGFMQSLAGEKVPSPALVIGSGGAAAAVMYAMREMRVPYVQVSRQGGAGQLLLSQVSSKDVEEHPFIINCTPVGTYGNADQQLVLPYEAITSKHFLYDLVYNPDVTSFLREGMWRGARVQNGLKMLHSQAEAAWRIWNR